jgi:hypothetical protein
MNFGVRSSISRVVALADNLTLIDNNRTHEGIRHDGSSTERRNLKGALHEKRIYLHK